ncbi:MAG: hypothetical protein QM765_39030 [Myxococcales bacterium]
MERRLRLDGSKLYVRNAVADSEDKPSGSDDVWPGKAMEELRELAKLVDRYRPMLLLSFGTFAFEFARRVTSLKRSRKLAGVCLAGVGQASAAATDRRGVRDVLSSATAAAVRDLPEGLHAAPATW